MKSKPEWKPTDKTSSKAQLQRYGGIYEPPKTRKRG